jgi:Ca2+-binding RTX toxin-like protein
MDVKLAGLMAQYAYDPNKLPEGWVFQGSVDSGYAEGQDKGAFRIYRNDSTYEIVFAFKGTNTFAELVDDIFNSGRTVIGNVLGRAEDELASIRDSQYSAYQVYTTGHSLGGAMAQTFALENSFHAYFFDSLPISSTRLHAYADANASGDIGQALANYANQGMSAIGTYYSGELADFRYRTVGGGLYLDSMMTAVPSATNELAAVATVVLAKAAGFVGLLAGFLGVKGNAHRMSVLNAAIAAFGVDPETGELLVPPSSPPEATQEGSQASLTPSGTVQLANGYVAEEISPDGALVVSKRDEGGNLLETLRYSTETDSSGGYDFKWERTTYGSSGEELTKDTIAPSSETEIQFVRAARIEGIEVTLGHYEFDFNGTLDQTSLPTLTDYGTALQAARTALAAQGLSSEAQMEKLASFEVGLASAALEFGHMVGADLNLLKTTLLEAADGLDKSIANASEDLMLDARYSGALFDWGQSLASNALRAFRNALDAALTVVSGSAEAAVPVPLRDEIRSSLKKVEFAAQNVVIQRGRSMNPFDDPAFDPEAAPLVTGGLDEGSVSTLTVYLPYEAGTGGQRVALELSGVGVEQLSVNSDGEEIALDADGGFTLTLGEGQREATFSLVAGADFDAGATFALSAQLVNAAGEATHLAHEEASITLNAEVEIPPAGGMELHGDWGLKLYPLTYPDGTPRLDQNGNQIYGPATDTRYPHGLNLERDANGAPDFGQQVPSLTGLDGPDRIWLGIYGGAGSASGLGGDDVFFGSPLAGNEIAGGAGNDWIEAFDYPNHAADYLEFAYLGRTIKLGEDKLYGGAGNDRIYGESEAGLASLYDPATAATNLPGDWASGGSGSDEVYGGAGDDVLMGGTGDDSLVGGAGMDVLLGDEHLLLRPEGNFWTVIHPNFGDFDPSFGEFEVGLFPVVNATLSFPDLIFPQTGDPDFTYYKNGGGADVLVGGAGKDILIGQAGDDLLYGGEDDDIGAGWEGADQILGGSGNDLLAGDFGRYEQVDQRTVDGVQLVRPGVLGSASAYGSAVEQTGDDFIDGGAGDDRIWGEGGSDVVLGGDGNDVLYGDAPYLPEDLHGADLLDGGAGVDILDGGGGDDRLFGGADNDDLSGGAGNDQVEGGAGEDYVSGGEGDDVLKGGDGADALFGDAGIDVLWGGSGADQLDGGADDDVLHGEAGADRLFGGDGNDSLYGGSGEDVIEGSAGNDLIDGGADIDVVRGGAGDDTYVLSLGYGRDIVEDTQGKNRIRFGSGVTPQDLSATLDQATLSTSVAYGFADDALKIGMAGFQLGAIEFADGSTWGEKQFLNLVPALATQGSIERDSLVGNPFLRNELRGLGGDDYITGGPNDDCLEGGEGADELEGGRGSDVFAFSGIENGVDTLADSGIAARAYLDWYYGNLAIADWAERGQYGGKYKVTGEDQDGPFTVYFDTYEEAYANYSWATIGYVEPLPSVAPLVRRDDAAAIANLVSAGVLDEDVVELAPGISLSDLTLTVTVASAGMENHPDQPWYGGGTLAVRWADGGGFDLEVPGVHYGFTGSNLLTDGTDPAVDAHGAWRGYRLGEGVEAFRFADGTTYSLEELLQQATVVVRSAYAFVRGSGSQLVEPTWTSIDFGADIVASEVTASRDGADLVFGLADGSAQGRIADWYAEPAAIPAMSFLFANGTRLDAEAVTRLGLTQYGTAGSDYLYADQDFSSALYGLEDADYLFGGAGNDLLDGGIGPDFLQGQEGDDLYLFASGYGQDLISEDPDDGGAGFDAVRFGVGVSPDDISLAQDYGTLVLTLGASGDALRVFRWFDAPGGSVERFEFADGTVWDGAIVTTMLPGLETPTEGDDALYGTLNGDVLDGLGGNDEIIGFAGHDVLDGGAGDDYVEGGAGFDILRGDDGVDDIEDWQDANLFDAGAGDDYVYHEGMSVVIGGAGDDWIDVYGDASVVAFNAGDGNDTVYAAGAMALSLGGGLVPADLALSQDGNDLVLAIGQGESIRLTREFEADPLAWPAITLQMFGSVHTYDFNAVMNDFYAAVVADPELTSFALDGVLQAHETAFSETDALGGAIAWQYATAGTTSGLTTEQIQSVLADPGFGAVAQPISFEAANSAPQVLNAIADQSASEDSAFTFQVPGGAFSDPNAGDTLAYSAGALPGWLSFNAETRSFAGTPAQADVGSVGITVTATDGGGLSVEDAFTLTVANVNDAPSVSAADSTVPLGATVQAQTLFSVFDEDGTAPAQYELWDSSAGNGHWTLNGIEQGVNVSIAVTGADLANAEFSASSSIGADLVWARAYDGEAWSGWKSWTVLSSPHATNALPVVSAPDGAVLLGESIAAASLFSVVDADGDGMVQYEFWDDLSGGGYFSLEGVAQGNNPIPVGGAQLADIEYVAGSQPGTEQIWVRASDGIGWSAWKAWNMTSALHIPNAAPEVAATANQAVLFDQAVEASAFFSATDADGDPIVRYELWDATAGGGRWTVNGVEQGVNVAIALSAADLANAQFVAASSSATDLVWARASDGQSWSDWKSWTVNSAPHIGNSAPVVTAGDAAVLVGEVASAAALFSVTDADSDAIASYELWDDVNGGGYWRVNGVQQAAAQTIALSAEDVAATDYVAGSGGTERVWARAFDGMAWSGWTSWNITSAIHVPNAAPVVTAAASQAVLLGQALEVSTLFSVSDADNDPIAQYEFWDSTVGGGHFAVNGVEQGVNVSIPVSAAGLSATQFVGGAASGTDTVWLRASDGESWSDWKSWYMQSAAHLTNAAPVASASNNGLLRGEAAAASSLFSVTDADGDAISAYQFWDDVNGGGYWRLNGIQQAAGQNIDVTGTDIANLDYVGAANAGTEQVWVRANDGLAWSAWKNWLMSTEGGMLRGGLGPDTLSGEAGPTVLEGGAGNDTLSDTEGNNLLSGNDGDDSLSGGAGNDLLAGGAGNDMLDTGAGSNVIAFNAGGGVDTVVSDAGAMNTLSFGGGIGYSDLSLSKDGNDLIVNAGAGEGVVLKDWYAGKDNVLDLQIVLEASDEFDATSSDALYNRKVQTFDFRGLVDEFDAALAQSPGLTSWQVTNALLQFHLSGADDAALGGDLAYWYGKNGGLAGISLAAAQQVIGAAGFGSDAQSLRPFSGLQEGFVKLA